MLMTRKGRAHRLRHADGRTRALVAAAAVASIMGLASPVCAVADSAPYPLPGDLPAALSSPPVDPSAPFTPTVVSLLRQLEPSQPDPVHDASPAPGTTPAQLNNAIALLHGTNSSTCTSVGSNAAPTGTTPAIAPLCWADALGVNVTSGAQVRQTTAPPLRVGMSSSWDTSLMNAWGQVAGGEARWLGITGIYAPQVDLLRIPNWGRNLAILGEDPFQDGTMAAAEVNGLQGKGLMDQAKHFAMYNGQVMAYPTAVQDQASHELYLTPYEYVASGSGTLPHPGLAASMMCSYQRYQIVPAPGVSGTPAGALGRAGGDQSCDSPVMNYVTRDQWGWQGFFASDYIFAMDSTAASINNGNDQEMPSSVWFGPPLVAAVFAGQVPLSTFNRSLARILYQEERFHLLGHLDANSNYLSPSNPTDATGAWAIGQAQKAHDAAIVEKASEEGSVLLKNADRTLPLSGGDLSGGVLVVGESAEYMPANPGPEAANGYYDRDAISPLEQLRQFAPVGSRITYLPYLPGTAPTVGDGVAIPQAALSSNGTTLGDGLTRATGPGSPRIDPQIDFTAVSGSGQLAAGTPYTWTGYVNVPTADNYTFRFQFSVPDVTPSAPGPLGLLPNPTPGGPSCSGSGAPTFSLATTAGMGQSTSTESLTASGNTLNGIPTNPTMSGFTERGLANCLFQAGTLSAGVHQIQITWTTPASLGTDRYHIREPGAGAPSLRFAYSRSAGDMADAVAAARSSSKVIVFVDCSCPAEIGGSSGNTNSLDANTTNLITSMAAANRNTAVVVNTDVATRMPWLGNVKSVLVTWYPGGEGGTATARLLLGFADPSGHLTSTWPINDSDTIFGYNETVPLYPGDSTGTHPERNPTAPPVSFDEGLFAGYRFFDREGITPLMPFGWGLSYTTFTFSNLHATPNQGGVDVSFDVTNTGAVAGAVVPQVYLGPVKSVPAGVQQADRSLRGFDRIRLSPGAAAHETIHLGPGVDANGHGDRRAFQYWSSPDQRWATAAGCRAVWVGDADATGRLPLSGSGDFDGTDKACNTTALRPASGASLVGGVAPSPNTATASTGAHAASVAVLSGLVPLTLRARSRRRRAMQASRRRHTD